MLGLTNLLVNQLVIEQVNLGYRGRDKKGDVIGRSSEEVTY